MNIIFFGPPGSGKGTQAKILSKQLSISHLSTGDILRNKLNERDDLSLKLKEIMSSGNLVSDKLLNEIVGQKLNSKDCENGFILDGYPRTLPQAEYLISLTKKNNLALDFIFDFKIDFKLIEERIMNRYSEEKRPDDNLETIKTRLDKYNKETYPVSQYFSTNFTDNFFDINASQEILEIQTELGKIIKKGSN